MAPNQVYSAYWQRYLFLLLLVVFVLKGLLWADLMPLFQSPDEQVHYGTIQHRAEPHKKNWPVIDGSRDLHDSSNITTLHFSEEMTRAAQILQFDEIKWQRENNQKFSDSSVGEQEAAISANTWKHYIDRFPPTVSGTTSLYYSVSIFIERSLADQSFFVRFFAVRCFSVALGFLIVWLTYLASRRVGFSSWQSVCLAALIAFQPMFSASASMVNIDIMLILAYSLFVYFAVSLLKKGFNWRDAVLLIASAVLGIYSKGPGLVLIVVLLFLMVSTACVHFNLGRKQCLRYGTLALLLVALVSAILIPRHYWISIASYKPVSVFSSPAQSLIQYADKTMDRDHFFETTVSYWGNFGWLDTRMPDTPLRFIWIVEIFAFTGVILYLLTKKSTDYLPPKKYIWLCFGLILALQLAIRFYDWRVFDGTGKIIISTTGRYFLPNIIPHMLLLVTGLGFFTQNKGQFNILLKTLVILMILLSLYSILDVIIPRYYL